MFTAIERKRILIFVAVACGLPLLVYLGILMGGEAYRAYLDAATVQARNLRVLLMFTPLIGHLTARLITGEGWSNHLLRIDFRQGRWRFYLAAWLLPLVATSLGAATYFLLFPAHFDPSMALYRDQGLSPIAGNMQPWTFWLSQLGFALAAPFSEALLLSFGEESGWRGYLLPRLMPLGSLKAVLLVGAIHGMWHWPTILTGFNYGTDYWGAPVVGPLLYVVVVGIFPSVLDAWVTLRSGSVWPAVLCHGALNASGRLSWLFFRGEPNFLIGPGIQGVVGSLGFGLLALLIILNRRALAPIDTPERTTHALSQAHSRLMGNEYKTR